MNLGKKLTLNNVLHVPDNHKNLVSGSLLSKKGFKLVFESDKFVLTKSEMYVRKGYMSDGLFKMNVMTIISNINKNTSSTYMLELSNVWYGRLWNVNYNTMHILVNLELLPKFHIDSNHKCETCVESKWTRSLFNSIERSIEQLKLIYNDICDLKFVELEVLKSTSLLFINDCIRYYHVYLLRTKDEALEMFTH